MFFSGTISRRSTFGTTAYNTNTMTLSPPYPIRRTADSSYAAIAYNVAIDTEESLQALSLARRWPVLLSTLSASICVACASSMVRCDRSLLSEGDLL